MTSGDTATPRIELHCHLDASLRMSTLVELTETAGLTHPRPVHEMAVVPEDCSSLAEFLTAIDVQLDVLQSPDVIERAATELVEDFAIDGVIHGEIRFAPHLHRRAGAALEDVIEAAHQGAQRAAATAGISTSIILCVLRHRDPAEGDELIAAIDRLPGRVQGVDIAGPEAGFPATPFERTFREAARRGLGITMHAGEAAGPPNVWQALEFGATRIGHGVRSVSDPALVETLAADRVTLECCPQSNVRTRAVASIDTHPIEALRRAGVPVTVSTDTRTLLPTTLGTELGVVRDQFGWTDREIARSQLDAADAAFVTPERRDELRAQILASKV